MHVQIVYSLYEYHTATAIPYSKAVVQYYLLLLSEQERVISVRVAVGTANQSKQECLSDMEYRDHRRDLPAAVASIVLLVLAMLRDYKDTYIESTVGACAWA